MTEMCLSSKYKHYVKDDERITRNARRIFTIALLLRCFALAIVMASGSEMSFGFLGPQYTNDDARYQLGAESYAASANTLVDSDAFTTAFANYNDWTGFDLQASPLALFTKGCAWYLIVCGLVYLTKSTITIRILNILFGSLAVIYIYEFAEITCGERIAKLAAKLYAYLPYPVIFCCFCYKDQLIMLLTFYLLCISIRLRYGVRIYKTDIPKSIAAGLLLFMLRSGVSLILITICLIIALIKKEAKRAIDCRLLLIIIPVVFIALYACKWTGVIDSIFYKLNSYMTNHAQAESGTGISLVLIRSYKELYKLPLAFTFAAINPFGILLQPSSWANIVSMLNVCMIPIALAASFQILRHRSDYLVNWLLLAYLCITLMTSINVFRHYYSLLPLYLVWSSEFFNNSDKQEKAVVIVLSFATLLVLTLYYI